VVQVFHQPSDEYRNVGDARAAGVDAHCAKSPQERLPVSLQDFLQSQKQVSFLVAYFITKFLIQKS
jgi:hypothetical protein